MHWAGIAGGGRGPGPVDELADPLAVGDLHRVLHQRGRDRHIVDFLEAACTLALQGRGAGDEDDRRAFAAGFQHGRHRIGESLRPDQADRGLAGDPGMPVGEMPSDLLVRAVDHRHLTFHEAFQRRIAESARQGEDVIDALLLQRPCQQRAAAKSSLLGHGIRSSTGRPPIDPACRPRCAGRPGASPEWRPRRQPALLRTVARAPSVQAAPARCPDPRP